MIINISKADYERIESFVEVIEEATQSSYNKGYKRIHIKEDIITGKVLEIDMPDEEATSYICAKIRPFTLAKDKYTRIVEILRTIIINEDNDLKLKHEALIQKSETFINEALQDTNFKLYMYGKYAKSDIEKRKKIKQAPKLIEAGFHNALIKLFIGLANLANLYLFLKEKYIIKSKNHTNKKATTYTFGI